MQGTTRSAGVSVKQMRSVEALSRDICTRNGIPADRVLAHSDVAPGRKIDPGERFDWKGLALGGVGHWVQPARVRAQDEGLGLGATDRWFARCRTCCAAMAMAWSRPGTRPADRAGSERVPTAFPAAACRWPHRSVEPGDVGEADRRAAFASGGLMAHAEGQAEAGANGMARVFGGHPAGCRRCFSPSSGSAFPITGCARC